MKMQLSEIARALKIEPHKEWEEITITSVSFDSRALRPGALFIPLLGEQDGHRYVDAAIENGALAVLWQTDQSLVAFGISKTVMPVVLSVNVSWGLCQAFHGPPGPLPQCVRRAASAGHCNAAHTEGTRCSLPGL